MNNFVSSLIRTYVPIGVGILVAWLAANAGFVLDEQSQASLIAGATGAAIALYYTAIRWLEQKFPAFGWFLGLAKQPGYSTEGAPPAQPAPNDGGQVTLGVVVSIVTIVFMIVGTIWFADNMGWFN